MEWKYGDAGDRYPIQVGDVWRVGDHVLACGDLEKGAARALLTSVPRPDLACVDPPWSAGNARTFRTKARSDGEHGRPVDFFGKLIPFVLDALLHVDGPVGVEFGRQHVDGMERLARESGFEIVRRDEITYYGKSPCTFTQMARADLAKTSTNLGGLDEPDAVLEFIRFHGKRGQTIFDPCMGRGLTAEVGHRLGLRVVGTELNPRRLAVTVDRLAKSGAGVPTKIGNL